jgi:uncharacterized protein YciI
MQVMVRRWGSRAIAQAAGIDTSGNDGVVDLDAYEIVFLVRPQDAPDYDEPTLDRIQQEHLAFHANLRARGEVVTNGPLIDPPDASLRGITIYRTGSVDRARQLAEQDPAVRAGRLSVQAMVWWCPSGTMVRPGRRVNLADDQ